MLLAKREGVLSKPSLHHAMVQSTWTIEIKSVCRLNNNSNENTVICSNLFKQEPGINRWNTAISEYTNLSINALTSALIHLDDEEISIRIFWWITVFSLELLFSLRTDLISMVQMLCTIAW